MSVFDNRGLYWSAGDLRKLHKMYIRGKSLTYIAEILGRTESACELRLRIIRTSILFTDGQGSDTLSSIKLR